MKGDQIRKIICYWVPGLSLNYFESNKLFLLLLFRVLVAIIFYDMSTILSTNIKKSFRLES